MSLENNNDSRQELYDEFRQSLAAATADRFYDADDLVIIFDQANDLEDDYVMIEAVMRGYRYFPDNQQLAMRRSQLYFTLEIDEGARQTLSQAPEADSTLCRIMSLRSQEPMPSKAEAQKALQDIVDNAEKLDSEEIIQLMSCAECLNVTDWIYASEDLLRKKADYLTGLVNELYLMAYNAGSYDGDGNNLALRYAEELTETEPLNADFWISLAREYGRDERYADTHMALDYALAIDSENAAAIGLKATTYAFEEKYSEALDTIGDTAHADNPDVDTAALYIRLLIKTGKEDEALAYGKKYLQKFSDTDVAVVYLSAFPQHTDTILDSVLGDNPFARSVIVKEWADKLHESGAFGPAASIYMRLFTEQLLDIETVPRLSSALYAANRLSQCAAILSTAIEERPELLSPDVAVAGLLSAARILPKKEVKELLDALRKHFPLSVSSPWSLSASMTYTSFAAFINSLDNELNAPGEFARNSNIFYFFQIPEPTNK